MSWVWAVQIGLPPDSHHVSDQNILAGWDAELCQLCCLLARSWCNLGWWCHTLDLFQLLEQLTPAAVCWFQRLVFWVINDEAAMSIHFFVMSLSAYIRTISSSVYSCANWRSCSGFWRISSLSDILLWKHRHYHYTTFHYWSYIFANWFLYLLHAESSALYTKKVRIWLWLSCNLTYKLNYTVKAFSKLEN